MGTGVPPLTSMGGQESPAMASLCQTWMVAALSALPLQGLGLELESCKQRSPKHPPSSVASPSSRCLGLKSPTHAGCLDELSPGHRAGLVLDLLQICHWDMFLTAHSRFYPQQSATIRRIKSKALRGTFPTTATTHSRGSSGPCSHPATSCSVASGLLWEQAPCPLHPR